MGPSASEADDRLAAAAAAAADDAGNLMAGGGTSVPPASVAVEGPIEALPRRVVCAAPDGWAVVAVLL